MKTSDFDTRDRQDRPQPDTSSGNGQAAGLSSDAAILLVDDDPIVSRALEIVFRMAGHRLDRASGPEEAYSRLAGRRYDAILLDMNFAPGRSNGEEGLAFLGRVRSHDPSACVVVITAHSGVRIAIAAMQAGARDFVMKPWRNAELLAKVEAAIARGGSGVPSAPSRPKASLDPPARLIGESPAIEALRGVIARVAPTRASVTVTGPPGAGRHLTALAVHASSADADRPPTRIDLRDQAAWQTLSAQSGVLLLRYPDRIDAVAQARLLDRLGPGVRCLAVADSAAPLIPALRRRIATVELSVPPLEARGDDCLRLARHFAREAAERFGRPLPRLTGAAEAAIRAGDWPDQVRGLALAIERAVLLAEDGQIDAAAIALPAAPPAARAAMRGFDLDGAERALIEAALREHRHNVTRAATALGLSRGSLYRRMSRHGL